MDVFKRYYWLELLENKSSQAVAYQFMQSMDHQ